MITLKRSRLSLQQALTIPFVVLILVLALTIVALSYQTASRAVDTVSSHLLIETVGRIGQAVDRHIMGSGAVLEAAFPEGLPAAAAIDDELSSLRTRFWIATSLHMDPNNYVYFGNKSGQGVGLYRLSPTEGELRIKLKAEDTRSFYRFRDIDGALALQSRESKLFDPRTRPWYKAGEAGSLHTWTSVYIDFVTEDLVATRARRVLNAAGGFEGVVATDVSLRKLNDFVNNLKVSPHGMAFIVEPNGDLIASSVGANVKAGVNGMKLRVSAAQSGLPLLAAAHEEVQKHLARAGQVSGPQTFNFTAPDGQLIHAGFDRLKDDAGLEWITVVAMPRSDFMAGVTENVTHTAVLTAVAVLLAAGLGWRALTLLTADLKHLSDAAMRVQSGAVSWPEGVNRPGEVGQLAQSFESIQKRLQTDVLTRVANRDAFTYTLRQKIAHANTQPGGQRFAVLFIDLNHFKHINDHYGHGVGDRVLIEVAQRLRRTVRPQDLVARLSGDEFVVLIDQVDHAAHLEQLRQQIHVALKEPLQALGKQAMGGDAFGGSVGEALFPDDGVDAESLLKKADRRMYNQKFASRSEADGGPSRRASDALWQETTIA